MRGARSSIPRTVAAPASSGVIRLSSQSGRFCCRRSPCLLEGVLHEFGVDPAEVGDAGAGAERHQLGPQRPAQRLDPGLGDGVGAVEDAVDEGVDRGGDDHLALALDDLRQRRAHGAPDAEHVDLEDPFPLLAADAAHGRHLLLGDAGVGDDDVEPAEALDRLGDRRITALWSVTSAPIPIARAPIRSAASRASPASRSTTATETPRRCICRAVSKPIPRAAPVTSATFPLRS